MFAIYKREMRSYFTTAAGYVFVAVFLAASGFLFGYLTMQVNKSTDAGMYFQFLMFAYIVLLPLLTMRTFSEERRTRTEQLLLTSPVSIFSMVAAKFFAAFTMFLGTISLTLLYFLPLSKYGEINMVRAFGCFIAVVFVGACFIAVGVFVSSLTENQFTAAIGTIVILLVMMLLAFVNSLIDVKWIRDVLSFFSIFTRYGAFTYGLFDYAASVYYLSVCGLFLFLACRVFERRRWS